MPANSSERRVVITGIGVVSPLGRMDDLWKNVLAGECGIGPITLFDAAKFDTQIAAEVNNFGATPAFPSPKDVRRTDRYAQFGVAAGFDALKDSGLDLDKINRDETGVFIGSGIGGLKTVEEQHEILLQRGP